MIEMLTPETPYPDQWPEALMLALALEEAERIEKPLRDALESGAMADDLCVVREQPERIGFPFNYRIR